LAGTDVLMIAAGGTWTLDGAAAAKLAWQSGARAVVPMHCADPRVNLALLPVAEFLQAWPGPVVYADQLDSALLAGLTAATAVVLSAP
jgi:L-ascorbate metabolism protein UlaG (beta-lactamase superfamily)